MRFLLSLLLLLASPAAAQDYNLENQSGAAFRAELNTILQSVATTNAGTTDPSTLTSFADGGMLWYDTNPASPILRLRNAANTAWLDVLSDNGSEVDFTADDVFVGYNQATGGGSTALIGGSSNVLFIAPTDGAGSYDFADELRYDRAEGYWTVESALAIDGGIEGLLNLANNQIANVDGIRFTDDQDTPGHSVDGIGWSTLNGLNLYENGVRRSVVGTVGFLHYDTDGTSEVVRINGSASRVQYDTPTEHAFEVNGTEKMEIAGDVRISDTLFVESSILPFQNGGVGNNVGNSATRFTTIFLTNNPDVSSDARLKDEIGPVLSAECRAADRLQAKRYKKDGLIHFGYIAQEVSAAFVAEGLDPDDYALVQTGEDGFLSVIHAEIEALKTACH